MAVIMVGIDVDNAIITFDLSTNSCSVVILAFPSSTVKLNFAYPPINRFLLVGRDFFIIIFFL